jgi:hypothetical protein
MATDPTFYPSQLLCLQTPQAAAGTSSFACSSVLPFDFTVLSLFAEVLGPSKDTFLRWGLSWGPVSSAAERAQASALILPQSSVQLPGEQPAIPVLWGQIAFAPLNLYVPSPGMRLWIECVNRQGAATAQAAASLMLSPGRAPRGYWSEVVPDEVLPAFSKSNPAKVPTT